MGAALRVGSRHDTATPAAPPTPRPEASRSVDARPGAGALVRAAAGALAAGALYMLACPPHEWSLLAWLVPGLLLVAVRRLGIVRALACGALFGVAIGYGITGWAYHAALEYFAFDRTLTAGFVVAVWLLYSGVPHALLCAAYAGLAERVPGWARGPLGAWLWVVSEWLRSTLGTGMPWELLGHTQFRHLAVIQIADLGGVYAVSFVMALASVSCAELLGQGRTAARPRPWWVELALPAAVLLATGLYGAYTRRLYAAAPAGRAVRTVAVVQGNIPNEFRWKRAFSERMLATYARLSGAARRARGRAGLHGGRRGPTSRDRRDADRGRHLLRGALPASGPGARPQGRRGPGQRLERLLARWRGRRRAAAALLDGRLPRDRDPPLPRARRRHRRLGVRRAERRDLREPRPRHGGDLGGARGHPAGRDRLCALGRALDRAGRRPPRAGGPARRAEARAMSPRLLRGGVVGAALAAGVLLLVVIVNTAQWVGTTFPGFFVMSNRVVPSIALPDWSDGDASRFFQHQVVAVDGVPVPTAAAVYEQARQRAPGTPVEYSFRSPEGHSLVAMVHARRFSTADYVLIFCA